MQDRPATGAKILIVEDEGIIAQDLRHMVHQLGYLVLAVAKSAPEALAAADQRRPDLVLMDIHIRGDLDGIQLANLFRHRFSTPVVYTTAHSDPVTLARVEESEPCGLILKPFRRNHVRASIEFGLHQARTQARLSARSSRLNALAKALLDALIATDALGHVTSMNTLAERWTETTAGTALGRRIDEILHLAEFDAVSAARLYVNIRDACEAQPDSFEIQGSQRRTVKAISVPVYRGDMYSGSAVVLRDETFRKQMLVCMREAQNAASRLGADLQNMQYALNHDLWEPIRTISLISQLLRRDLKNATPDIAKALDAITAACSQMDGQLAHVRETATSASLPLPPSS